MSKADRIANQNDYSWLHNIFHRGRQEHELMRPTMAAEPVEPAAAPQKPKDEFVCEAICVQTNPGAIVYQPSSPAMVPVIAQGDNIESAYRAMLQQCNGGDLQYYSVRASDADTKFPLSWEACYRVPDLQTGPKTPSADNNSSFSVCPK